MDDHNVTPHLVAAVQQLKAENEQINAKGEQKTRAIEGIRAELNALRQSTKPVVAS